MSSQWTPEEDARLRESWPRVEGLNRTPRAVKYRAHRLGLRNPSPNKWAQAEVDLLIEKWGGSWGTLEELLQRPKYSIRDKARRLGLRQRYPRAWTPEEDAELTWCWGVVHITTLAHKIRRSQSAINQRAYKTLGLRSMRVGDMSVKKAAEMLGYTAQAIKRLAELEGIELPAKPRVTPGRSRPKVIHRIVTAETYDLLLEALERRGFPRVIR